MSYRLVCKPGDAHAAANIRLLLNGRFHILFQSQTGEHEDVRQSLDDEMSKAVLGELTRTPQWAKYRRAYGELVAAQKQLDEMQIAEKTDALNKRREYIVEEVPANSAKQIQDVDREIADLGVKAASIREQIATLAPLVDTLRGQVEFLAKGISETAMHKQFEALNAHEVKTAATISAKAGALLADLARTKSAQQHAVRYASPEFGRVFVDRALAGTK